MKNKLKNIKINPIIFYTFLILYLEILNKIFICKDIFNIGILYTIIFTIPIIILLTLITKLFNPKINKLIMFITTIIITIYFEVQFVFFKLFSIPFSFSTIGLADQALDFTDIIKDSVLAYWPIVLAILIPVIILVITNKKIDTQKYSKYTVITLFILFIITYLSTFLTLIPNKKEHHSSYKLYYNVDAPLSIINRFGLITYSKIDIKRQIFGYEVELIVDEPIKKEEEIKYKKNIMDLDFDKPTDSQRITTLNNYFKNVEGTYQNQYTGMFKDKNLIFILAEGFNEIAVDKDRTPTLYKLINQGFVFEEFYTPLFLSTTGGEFQATTGLIPTQEILNTWKKNAPTMSFSIGNAFSKAGYQTQAYHNWTYKYYKRNVTMTTLGYQTYIGCGNGLENEMKCGWLPKDTDMINVTTPKYLNKEGNFATYYITVSGHSPYNKWDNIAKIHYDKVSNLPYSDSVKYYLASQIELDKALEQLINNLKESGQLEDTVIALVGDHYPYTLTNNEINEISTYEKDDTIEVNHSNFIIWNSEIKKPIKIDKVGSQIDVLPTLLNLFGIEYDSRLIIGKDILSDSECLAIFSNYSWVSDYGTYNATTNKFTLKEGKSLANTQEYVAKINSQVNNSFSVSKMIVEKNYYNYILNK